MKIGKHILLLLVGITLLTSCEGRLTDDPTLGVEFSQDTLRFDTIFTEMKSTTLSVKIRNPHKEALLIESVKLREGEYFRLNLDNETDLSKVRDIVLRGKDSLYLFVACLPEKQNSSTPLLIEDEVVFSVNGHTQSLWLEAYGQDAVIFGKDTILSDTVLSANLPYLLRDTLIFAGKVTTPAGTEFYLHDYPAMFFLGDVEAQGTLEAPILIRGDRLDNASTHIQYDYISGRWNGIYLLQPDDRPACSWRLNYVDIHSGTVGIYAVSYKLPTLLSIVSTIFMEAWQFSAVAESVGDKREHTIFFSRVWGAFQAVMFLAAAAITAFAKPLVHVLAAPSYYEAWTYVPVLSAAMVFSSLVSFLGSVYMVEKNSMRTLITAMVGALLNIALNLWLIPSPLGVQGAAIATCASYFVVFLIRAADVRRFIPFRLYPIGLTENSILLMVQIVFMVLELPGWIAVQAVCIALMLFLNRTPLLNTFGRILGMVKRRA